MREKIKEVSKEKQVRFQLGKDKFPEKYENYYRALQEKYNKARITVNIAREYEEKAKGVSLKELKRLRDELQVKYAVTELEATNILSGMHVQDYVNKYENMSKGIFYNVFGMDSHQEF